MFSITKKFIDARVQLQATQENDEGATAVEYGLIVGGIAVAIIVTVGLLGGAIDGLFNSILTQL